MYNEELKRRFIDEYTDSSMTVAICEGVFRMFEKYEEEWGADLCTVERAELQRVIDKEFKGRIRGIENKLFILKAYAKWCITNNVKGAKKSAFNVGAISIDDMRVRSVANPLHLSQYLDLIFRPDEIESQDSVYRCYYWLAFMGIQDTDVIELTTMDVDLNRMVVNCREKFKTYPIYWESIPTFRNCKELDYFMMENNKSVNLIRTHRVDSDLLLRSTKGTPKLQSFRSCASRYSLQKSEKTPMELTYKRVWTSGIFYRSFLDEAIGITPDFKKVSYDIEMEKRGEVKPEKLKARIYNFKVDYDRWKLAWYYRS